MKSRNSQKEAGEKTWKAPERAYIFRTVIIIIALVALDLATKTLASGHTRQLNLGVSFGLFPEMGNLFWLVVQLLIASVILVYVLSRRYPQIPRLGLALLVAGGFGNAISRLIWRSVPDWICILDFPCFNFADIMINTGVILYLIWMLDVGRRKQDQSSNKRAAE